MFVYSWFYDNATLYRYCDKTTLGGHEYCILNIDGFKSIDDMKNYAYEVFDKDFINKKFDSINEASVPAFKDSKEGIMILNGYVKTIAYDTSYQGYESHVNDDGTVVYKAILKSEISPYKCNLKYDFKLESNNDGKLVFKSFENSVTLCINSSEEN